jgi:hypothetical protein
MAWTVVGRLLIRKVQVRVLPGAPKPQVTDLQNLPGLLCGHSLVILWLSERHDRRVGGDPTAQGPSGPPGPGQQVAALVESLTEQELEVLRLLAARRSNAGIAAELVVEQSTSRRTSSMCTASWASTAVPRRWPAPARCGCSTDPAADSTSALHPLVDAPRPPRRQADDQTVTRQGGNQ